jgi:hypothetical protein
MTLPPEEQSGNDRMGQARKAYAFLCQAEREHRAFHLEELQQVTGYKPGTIEAYRSKIWTKFLTKHPDGRFTCHDLVAYPEERFLALHRQKKDPETWYQLLDRGSLRTVPSAAVLWRDALRLMAHVRTALLSLFF